MIQPLHYLPVSGAASLEQVWLLRYSSSKRGSKGLNSRYAKPHVRKKKSRYVGPFGALP